MTRRYDLVILGGGTGGLVAAQIAAGVGARVALVERERTGGDCLWTGCVPSKSLIASATAAHQMRHADALGLPAIDPQIDFARVMERVWQVIHTIEPNDSPAHLRAAGVEVIEADGRFTGPGRLEVGGRELRWRSAIIATGSGPLLPPINGLADADPLTTDTLWALRELPRRLLVLGGGPIGCELSQALSRLGAEVTVVELSDRLLLKEEPSASELVRSRLAGEGVRVLTGARATAIRHAHHGYELVLDGARAPVEFDRVLVVTGRRPRTTNLGLETVGVKLKQGGAVAVDQRLRTSARRIYAVGDVTDLLPFTHVAAHHARIATPNALFGARQKISSIVPWVTFTDHGPRLCSTFEGVNRKGVPLPDVHPSRSPGATASHDARLSVLAEHEASSTQVPAGEGVELRRTADGKGDGVMATRPFAAGETVMVGFLSGSALVRVLSARRVVRRRWASTACESRRDPR